MTGHHDREPLPEPTRQQIAYSRMAATRIAIQLIDDAIHALTEGTDMQPPRLPRASPTQDAITASSLRIIRNALADYTQRNTKGVSNADTLHEPQDIEERTL